MSANDIKLDDVQAVPPSAEDQETGFNNGDETVQFLPRSGADVEEQQQLLLEENNKKGDDDDDDSSIHHDDKQFYGLTREELEAYSSDPYWIRVRRILFAILVVCWVAMLVIAIVFVVVAPKCPPVPPLKWYEDGVAYKVNAGKFQDTDGDGKGDLKGIKNRVSHFEELSVASIWVGDVMDSSDRSQVNVDLGSMDDFKSLAAKFKKSGIRVVINLDIDDESQMDAANELVKKWTTAGAEGFVFPRPNNASDARYAELAAGLQAILDEINQKDDRARVIICDVDGVDVSAFPEVGAVIYKPQASCIGSNYQCVLAQLNALGSSTLERPWKIPQVEVNFENSSSSGLAFKLTIPGTPNVVYGDEIGMTGDLDSRAEMKWDDSDSGGFTNQSSWRPSSPSSVQSVLAQKAVGFDDTSFYSLFKQLAALRMEEPALKWGDFRLGYADGDIVHYVREAEGFPPILVVLSPSVSKAISLKDGDFAEAEVLYAGDMDVTVGEIIELDAIYMPKSAVLVLRIVVPEKKKVDYAFKYLANSSDD